MHAVRYAMPWHAINITFYKAHFSVVMLQKAQQSGEKKIFKARAGAWRKPSPGRVIFDPPHTHTL